MAGEADLMFGRLAIKFGFVDEPQIVEAIRTQQQLKEAGITKTLGAILEERGVMNPDQVQKVLHQQKYTEMREEDMRYGRLAVRNGFCTLEEVQQALAIQQNAVARKARVFPRLGEILREQGKLTAQQHESLKKAQVRLGKAPGHVDSSPKLTPVVAAGQRAGGEGGKCPVCGTPGKPDRGRCVICGSVLFEGQKAAEVVAVEMMRKHVDDESTLFGNVAVQLGFVNQVQLNACLTLQEHMRVQGTFKRLGEIMVGMSYLTQVQVERVVGEQLARRGEVVLDVGPRRQPGKPILGLPEFAGLPSVPAALPGAPRRKRKWRILSSEGRKLLPLLFRLKNTALGYAVLCGGAVLLLAAGYLVFRTVSGRLSSRSAETDPAKKAEDAAETARKAEQALKLAGDYEQMKAVTSTLKQIIEKYGEVADRYFDTPAGMEARIRRTRLTILFEDSQREFTRLQNDFGSACSANQFDKALRAVEKFIAQTLELTGKPFLEEANTLLQCGIGQAGLDFHRLLGEIKDGLASGRQDSALLQFAQLYDMRIIALCPESARAYAELQREIASIQAKIEADKQAAEQEAQRRGSWRTRVSATLAEARRFESEGQYAESLLEYKKAILFSGGSSSANEAVKGIAGLDTLVKETQTGLLSILSSARNWTVAKQYPKAIEKCSEVLTTPSFKPFYKKIESAVSGLNELKQDKGDPKAMMRRFDDLQKEINDWAERQLVIDASLACEVCDGDGSETCAGCAGSGQVEGPPCVVCGGGGKKCCEQCGGMGSLTCPTCRGTGTMSVSETQMQVCSWCRGTGSIACGTRCTRCGGSGRLKVNVTTGRMTCTGCGGTAIALCSFCDNGMMDCRGCRGTGKKLVACKQCNGAGGSRCKSCCGSGLVAEKY